MGTSRDEYAFLLDYWDVEYHINQELCELAMVGSFGNPLNRRMDKALSAMKNKGALELLKRTWWQGSCTDASDTHRPTLVTLMSIACYNCSFCDIIALMI